MTAMPRTTPSKKRNIYFTIKICNCQDLFSTPVALKRVQARYAMTMFNSKWKQKKSIIICLTQTSQNLVISHSYFAENGKEM